MATTKKTTANGSYEGTFRWGRSGEADITASFTRNDHGWFCDRVNGQEWLYGSPANPFGGWGDQVAKESPLEALRSFLGQWNEFGDGSTTDDHGCSTEADHLSIRKAI